MSRRPPNIKTTKTSSVSSKASSSSKTTSSGGSNSRSVSRGRPAAPSKSQSPTPSKAAGKNAPAAAAETPSKKAEAKADGKGEPKDDRKKVTESGKDVNNNLTPDQPPAAGDAKAADAPATPAASPAPMEKPSSLEKQQVPSSTSEIEDIISGKSKKAPKRKPSTMQHRNSKQDTAQLLRRKSLTPSAKLIILCKKGDWLAVETFLKQVDKKSIDNTVVNEENNWTPLMYAARENRVAIVERLIQLGFNVNAKADEDITALHVACANAREDTIKLLLMKRIDTMVPAGVGGRFGFWGFEFLIKNF